MMQVHPPLATTSRLPNEQEPNPWSTPDLTFRFHYFAMRKIHFAMRAAALVVFPGGFMHSMNSLKFSHSGKPAR